MASLLAFLDLNLGQAMTRQIVVAVGGHRNSAARISRGGFAILTAISLLLASALMATPLVPPLSTKIDIVAAGSACAIVVALLLTSGLAGVANALHRLLLVTAANAANVIATYVGFAVVPWATSSSDAMLIWSAGVSWAALAMALLLITRSAPLNWFVPQWSRGAIKELLSFALPSWWGRTANLAVTVGDRIIVGLLLGVAAVPLYYLPALLMKYLVSGMGIVSLVAFPAVVERWHQDSQTERATAYVRGTELFLLVAAGPPLVAMLWARPIIGVWLGARYVEPSAAVLTWASLAAIVTLASMMPFCVADAAGRPQLGGQARSIQALISISLSLPLGRVFGVAGVAFAFAIGALALWAYGAFFVERRLLNRYAFVLTAQALIRPTMVGLTIVGVAVAVRHIAGTDGTAAAVGIALCLLTWTLTALAVTVLPRASFVTQSIRSAMPTRGDN
jgi:O-antigen/teichoic acid export membrane protein